MWYQSACSWLLLCALVVVSRGDSQRQLAPIDGVQSSALQQMREVIQNSTLSLPTLMGAYTTAGVGAIACTLMLPQILQAGAGTIRAMRFWSRALPIYLQYRRCSIDPDMTQEEISHYWYVTHEKYAPEVLQLLLDLRGFYVKIGQVASTVPDMFPKPYIDSLKQLQGEHPEILARPFQEIRRIIDRDLGDRADAIATLNPRPVGAAATGQVHKATLQDGSQVVVKVQYPEANQLFLQDFANTRAWCTLLMPEYLPYIKEVQNSFMDEFDFRKEALDLAEISGNFDAATGNPYAGRVSIPRPVLELSSRNVVVMEFLPGETLLTYGLRKKRELENAFLPVALWRGWFLLRELRAHLELLIGVQGYQIFVDGVFNGDPHPGNILLMPDGRLGLIDYGNVNRMSLETRAGLGRMLIALAAEDKPQAVRFAKELGYTTERDDHEILYRYVRLAFDRDDPASMVMPDGTACANVHYYFAALEAADPLTNIPPGLVMSARNSILLRGLATHFGIRLRMAVAWKALAEYAANRPDDIPFREPRLRQHSFVGVHPFLSVAVIGCVLLIVARSMRHFCTRQRSVLSHSKPTGHAVVQNSNVIGG